MEKTKLKNILKITTLSLIFCFIGIIFAWLYISATQGVQIGVTAIKWTALAIIGAIVFIDFFIIMVYAGSALINKKEIIPNDNYEREVPKEIPPAIASLLLDYIIDNERDYTATVASLIAKGYIAINDNEQLRIFKWDKENLLEHERVVFQALAKEEIYNEEKFKEAVRNDALNIGVIERKRKKYTYLIPIIILFAIIWLIRPDAQETFNPVMQLLFIVAWILLTIFVIILGIFSSQKQPNTEKGRFIRTELGTEKAKKLTGLKKFLHDYTMLKEKGLEDTILYDDYIAYAIVLGEAEAIEDVILNNSKYRELVYKKPKENDNPIQKFY